MSVGGSWAGTGIPAAVASALYDSANRITTWNGASLANDLNGNLASDGLTSYTWNARNQLIGVSGGVSASFAYDGVGQRRTRTTSGSTSYLYDGANATQELVGGSPTANVLSGGVDEVFQRTDGSGTRAVLTDALGSTVALVRIRRGADAIHVRPFGATTVSGAASTNPAQFTGRENDGGDLYFYRARYRSQSTGQFISEDRAGFVDGSNLYSYVGDAPTNFTDPGGGPSRCRARFTLRNRVASQSGGYS